MSAASGLEHLKPFLPGLESALEDSEVSEIMINGPANVWVERAGRLTAHAAPDLDEAALLRTAIHIARPLGLDPAGLRRDLYAVKDRVMTDRSSVGFMLWKSKSTGTLANVLRLLAQAARILGMQCARIDPRT